MCIFSIRIILNILHIMNINKCLNRFVFLNICTIFINLEIKKGIQK